MISNDLPDLTEKEINNLLAEAEYKVAKTMPTLPHSYTMGKKWENINVYYAVVKHILENSKKEYWKYGKYYNYYYANGYKYWLSADTYKAFWINKARPTRNFHS